MDPKFYYRSIERNSNEARDRELRVISNCVTERVIRYFSNDSQELFDSAIIIIIRFDFILRKIELRFDAKDLFIL